MIFVTVGTQLAFDRLVIPMDEWAADHRDIKIFAQTGRGKHKPLFMQHADFLPPVQVSQLMQKAELIVSHAGMGTILTAMQMQKPILVMPRKAALGEHRNDHQVATAKWLANRRGINIAWNEKELKDFLEKRTQLESGPALADYAEGSLVKRLSDFIRSS